MAEGRQFAGVPREAVRILTLAQNKDFRLPWQLKCSCAFVSNTMHFETRSWTKQLVVTAVAEE